MDNEKIWHTVLETLKINLSTASFSTWFPQTYIFNFKPIDDERQIAEIGCPSLFVRNNVENRYYALIKEAIDQATGKKNDLIFIIKQMAPTSKESQKKPGPLFENKQDEIAQDLLPVLRKSGLRKDLNFENFAVSSTNQMAHAAALAVAQAPGKAYNPLFLYGGVGVGKTHLMQAVAQQILEKNPKAKVIYCTSEDFTNEIVNAIRRKNTDEFKDKYRSARLLLVDDIQFIAGKDRAQEEFFHTFNSISRTGGQIVLTSDRRPDEISKLEDRLRSRFEGGLAIDIQPPDFELRSAILLIKAQQKKIDLPMDVAQLIASNITSTRRLEGTLTRLITEAETRKEPITPEMAEAILGKANGATGTRKAIKNKDLIRIVALYFNQKVSDITGPRRTKSLVMPRQIAMYLLKTELDLPLVEIGRLLGNRDHTTIIHGVDKITHNLSTSETMRVDIAGIKQQLYG